MRFLAECSKLRRNQGRTVNQSVANQAQALDGVCQKPHSMGFRFIDGAPLRVTLYHLQAFELFLHQLLSALNLALAEHPDAGQ